MITHGNQLRIGGTYRFTSPGYAKDYGDWTITHKSGGLFYATLANCPRAGATQGMVYEFTPLTRDLACVEVYPEPDECEAFFVE